MRNVPNYGEFYQRALITIGESDRSSVDCETCTHWLIALEGSEMDKDTGSYHWNVVVFPSKKCGGFNYKLPYFVSERFTSIHKAIDYTSQLEKMAKEDQLFTIVK